MAAKKVQTVEIPALKLERIELSIVGDTPLLCHAWSIKAKKQMLDKQMKKAKQGKEAKDPKKDFSNSLYWLNDKDELINPLTIDPHKHKRFGVKSIAFKAAAVRAANDVELPMTFVRRTFRVESEFVPLKYKKLVMREDTVRLNGTTTDLRYRGEFHDWRVTLSILFNSTVITPEQLVNLMNTAGFGVGVCEWRPERNGSHGTFHVE